MKSEELQKRHEAELAEARRTQQARLDQQMQEMVDSWLAGELGSPISGNTEFQERVPAIIELAGLVRVLAISKVMVPPGLPEHLRNDLLKFLYEEVDGEHFVHQDTEYWEAGTHQLDYEGVA